MIPGKYYKHPKFVDVFFRLEKLNKEKATLVWFNKGQGSGAYFTSIISEATIDETKEKEFIEVDDEGVVL